MTAHWPLVIFHNIIVSSYNAFVIWNKINPTLMPDKNKRVFLEQLGKALVTPHIQRERLPRKAASAALGKTIQGLNLILIHLRLQQARADATSATQRTVKQIL